MNYQEIHDRIILRAKLEQREKLNHNDPNYVYYEAHHILPKCIYPQYKNFKNYPWNKVLLTAREHYVIHQILIKIYPKNKNLIWAAKAMTIANKNQDIRSNNRLYSWLREKMSIEMSNRDISEETREKMSSSTKGRVPWNKNVPQTVYVKDCVRKANTGKKHTDDHKEKNRLSNLGRNKGKSIDEIHGKEKADDLRLKNSIAHKGQNLNKTFEEIYGEEEGKIKREKISNKLKGKKFSETRKQNISISRSKNPIICMELNMIFRSAAGAARYINGDRGLILNCAKGIYKSAYKLTWKFVNEQNHSQIQNY